MSPNSVIQAVAKWLSLLREYPAVKADRRQLPPSEFGRNQRWMHASPPPSEWKPEPCPAGGQPWGPREDHSGRVPLYARSHSCLLPIHMNEPIYLWSLGMVFTKFLEKGHDEKRMHERHSFFLSEGNLSFNSISVWTCSSSLHFWMCLY